MLFGLCIPALAQCELGQFGKRGRAVFHGLTGYFKAIPAVYPISPACLYQSVIIVCRRIIGVDTQSPHHAGQRLRIVQPAIQQHRFFYQRRSIIGVLRQAGLQLFFGCRIVAATDLLLALQIQTIQRIPIEILRHGHRPGQDIRLVVADINQFVVAQFHSDLIESGRSGDLEGQSAQRTQVHTPAEKQFAVRIHAKRVLNGLNRAEQQRPITAASDRVERSVGIGVQQALCRQRGKPVFFPGVSAIRRKSAMLKRRQGAVFFRLIKEPAALYFHILPVLIGEQLFPDHALLRESPDPYLFARFFMARSIAGHAEILIMPVGAEEIGVTAKHMIGFITAEIIVLIIGKITAVGLVAVPGMNLAVVLQVAGAGVNELQISRSRNGGVHPGIVRLLEGGGVMPEGRCGEIGLVARQLNLQPPASAGEQVENADKAGGAAVLVLYAEIIHRRGAVRAMADDPIVGLDAPAGPGPAQGDVAEFHRPVVIDERPAGALFNGGPDFPSNLRQDQHPQILVLQLHNLPLFLHRLV
ncbi:MAG: hypothetical protein BWY83_01725 [bacterium ADurb.Bin478]|nr:MAG: hypothetical protein BWY83_01725 [bacterium ADurb.Bin478]